MKVQVRLYSCHRNRAPLVPIILWAEANVISNIEGVNAQAESTGASVENATLIQNKTDIAMIQNDIAFYAANGVELPTLLNQEPMTI